VGPDTAVVPLLNGMRHLDALDARFGADRVLGGSCFITAKLHEGGHITHVGDIHRLTFGERAGGRPPRGEAPAPAMAGVELGGGGGGGGEGGGEVGGGGGGGDVAGDVGQVGVPGVAGRDHVPDAVGGP